MEKASDQQTKTITSQKTRLKVPNQRNFIIKSGSNRTEKYTNRNNQTDTFPLRSISHLGG
jgi:hypothetical protein